MEAREANLFYTAGSSDKVYQARLVPEGEGWVVEFQYGRRGKPLKAGRKTKDPLPYEKAVAVYDKLVASKTSKGYTPEETGVLYAGTENAGRRTGFQPQLLTPVSTEEAVALASSGHWLLQEKHDGERRGILHDGDLRASNRKGLEVGLQAPVANAVERLAAMGLAPLTLDGEDMGDHVVVFDVLRLAGEDVASLSFAERAGRLAEIDEIVESAGLSDHLRIDLPILPGSEDAFRSDIAARRERGDEGIVLRRADAPWSPGRPASGGSALKLKFVETATLRVKDTSASRRSIALEALDGETWVPVGNCTVPSNQNTPPAGVLVEIEYLYAYAGGSLYQPVLRGVRTDLDETDATMGQLKTRT